MKALTKVLLGLAGGVGIGVVAACIGKKKQKDENEELVKVTEEDSDLDDDAE